MLIDRFLPTFDFNEVHSTVVDAPAARVFDALLTTDLGRSWLVQLLMGARSLPSLLSGRDRTREPLTVRTASRAGFGLLAEDAPREIVLGIEGRFWKMRPEACAADAATFERPIPAGVARAAWNFSVESLGVARSRLSTETRIACGDAQSRRRFGIYWRLIQPGSGIIRLAILRQIRREATGVDA